MTDRIEVDGVVYHVETGHVFEANSAFVWKEKFDKKSEKNFYVNLSTNEKKWSLPKSATKKKSTLGSSSADMGAASPTTGGGPLTVPGFGSLLAFQPAEPPATAAPLDAAAKKKSSVVKKKKKEDGSDGAGLTKTKSSKKSSGAASSGEGLDVPATKGDEGGGSDDDDNDNISAASPPPVPPTFSSFPSILVEEASDALSFPGSPSASKATKTTKTKAASFKTLKKSKSDVTGGDGGVDDVVGAENTDMRPGDDAATGADAAASPLKKKKSSTVKKGTTKKNKKTTNDADATAASGATGGTENNNDDDGDEEEDGGDEGQVHEPIVVTQHLAPPGPSSATNHPTSPSPSSWGGEEKHAFDDIPLYSSVMIPNTPTTELPNAASFFNAAQPPRGGADRTPRQVSFVGDAGELEGNVPLPQSRVGSLWGDELTPSSSRGKESRGAAEEVGLRVPSADTNYPSVDEEHSPQLGGDDMASWKSLQESFSSMMTGINGGNSAAAVSSSQLPSSSAEVSPVVDSLSSPSAYRLPRARIPDLASSSQSQRLMVVGRNTTQQLQGDWAAIMEPIDRPHGRLEQPEGRVLAATHPDSLRSRTREHQSLPPAALSQADMLHDDETSSPARVVRVAQAFRSSALTAVETPAVNASATAMTTTRVTTSPSRWDQQRHGGNRGDDESNADPFHDEWTARATMTTNNITTTTTITSPQPLVDDDLLPATIVRRPQQAPVVTAAVNAPQTEGNVTQQQQVQNGRSRTTSPRQQLHLSPPAVTIRNDRRSTATDASAQELLLRSLDDEDDATFFRGDDFVTQPPRVPAASSVTRPSGISSTRGKSPVVGTRHAAAVTPPSQAIRRAAPTGGVAAFQGGGGGGGGGGAVSSRAVTPNRQIATGPRYIQATARYPSSFAPQRTRSPEPVATATSSRTPTPSIALPRHSRSPHISPQPSRSPSIPIPSHSSYPYSSAYQTHHHHASSSPHYNHHDNIPLYHRSSQYEPLAVIDSQHVRVASKNGGKAPAASHHHNRSNNIASTSRPNPASAHDESYNSAADPPAQNASQPLPQQHPQPIIIYTSPPPPNMAGPLGWWGPPLQGNIPYTGPQQGASPMPTMPAMNEHSPPPSAKAAAPVFVNDVSSSEQRPQRPLSHRAGGGRKIFPLTTSSGEQQGTSTSYLHTLAAMRVGERYKDACPSSTDFGSVTAASRPPHIPSTLLGYLKPAELQQLEQLQQGWHAARDRAARLRLGSQTSYQTLTRSTKSSLEALRSRQEALLASQTRTHEVTWQHHLATLGGQQ